MWTDNSALLFIHRLTFWWSNIIVLREIINQTLGSLNQLTSPVSNQSDKPDFTEFVDKSRETRFLTSEIEKLESEIFSRIVESIWCQVQTLQCKTCTLII